MHALARCLIVALFAFVFAPLAYAQTWPVKRHAKRVGLNFLSLIAASVAFAARAIGYALC